ncbi:MAG TPA: hypothetical protein VHW69_17055 [Rhizomicrobium sp.]|nr:hypothetical protein [Rhizomicrobium sp.]
MDESFPRMTKVQTLLSHFRVLRPLSLGTLLLSLSNGTISSADAKTVNFRIYEDHFALPPFVQSINNSLSTVGYFPGVDGINHGFLRTADGSITSFDAQEDSCETIPYSINQAGTVVGAHASGDGCSVSVGFLRSAEGAISTFTVPDALWTNANSINDAV